MGKKKMKYVLMLAALAGIFFILCGAGGARMPAGARVDGVDVSGLSLPAAEKKIRLSLREQLSEKALVIVADGKKYVFRYPEIGVRTDLNEALKKARKGGNVPLKKRYFLTAKERVLRGICDDFYRRSQNASLRFDPDADEPFSFEAERSGRYLDGAVLSRAVEESLSGDFAEVRVSSVRVSARVTVLKLRESVALLSRFSTKFNPSAAGRARNIELAAEKINGAVVAPGETFSFNACVGERTRANGFCEAPIIFEGDFVAGVGGGVCQVSTTLYNAALLSGMKIEEYHPHSLSVGYVEPSFDAMVSGKNADLRFTNETGMPVYILCRAGGGRIEICVYGRKSAFSYRRESVVTGRIEPPEPVYAESENAKLRSAKDGILSAGYLVKLKNGVPVEKKLLRRDRYAAVGAVLAKPAEEQVFPGAPAGTSFRFLNGT